MIRRLIQVLVESERAVEAEGGTLPRARVLNGRTMDAALLNRILQLGPGDTSKRAELFRAQPLLFRDGFVQSGQLCLDPIDRFHQMKQQFCLHSF